MPIDRVPEPHSLATKIKAAILYGAIAFVVLGLINTFLVHDGITEVIASFRCPPPTHPSAANWPIAPFTDWARVLITGCTD